MNLKNVSFGNLPRISLRTELSIDRDGKLNLGKKFNMRGGSRVRVRKGAELSIGDNVSIANNCMVVCRDKIIIGNDVQIAPGVLIYDHDHDYKAEGGLKAGKYKTEQIFIGNNVWIGAHTVILRGTVIGDNCVIGAGSVVKGKIPENKVLIQKRNFEMLPLLR